MEVHVAFFFSFSRFPQANKKFLFSYFFSKILKKKSKYIIYIIRHIFLYVHHIKIITHIYYFQWGNVKKILRFFHFTASSAPAQPILCHVPIACSWTHSTPSNCHMISSPYGTICGGFLACVSPLDRLDLWWLWGVPSPDRLDLRSACNAQNI